jgi:glycosyltransferase involved in cell wall biosynthesis
MPLRVLHLITHFAVGGATEPTITTCQYLDPAQFEGVILSGVTDPDQQTMLPQATAAGVTVEILPSLRRAIRPRQDRKAFRDLVAWMQKDHWDIVHTHGSKAGVLGRLAAAKAGVPIIIHNVHGWGHHGHMNPLARRFYVLAERRAARVTDRFILDATANRDKGLSDGIGRHGQYVTVYNGIDIERFRDVTVDRAALRTSLGIPLDAPVVGTVGRLAPQKAPDDFVRMAAAIHAQRPDAHFVFVGGGPLEEQIVAQIQDAGLGSVVHLLGYRNDVPELLRVFDVFALTSLWEGLPRVFAQAMCARLPIVATHVDGAAEAIREGENGFLVPARRPDEQAERVLRLLNDPARRESMGRRGLDLVFPQFCERQMVRRIEEIYLECAREKNLIPVASHSPQTGVREAAQETVVL